MGLTDGIVLNHIITYMHAEVVYLRQDPAHRTVSTTYQDTEWIKVSEQMQPTNERLSSHNN